MSYICTTDYVTCGKLYILSQTSVLCRIFYSKIGIDLDKGVNASYKLEQQMKCINCN